MNYSSVLDFDANNGDGIRVSLFVTGCPHGCKGCHNRDLWDKEVGKPFTNKSLSGLLNLLEKDMSKGFSVLGGEPLAPYNIDEVTRICKAVKQKYPEKSIWLWTGYDFDYVNGKEIMQYLDVVVDGKYIEELKDETLKWCGSSNQTVWRTYRI